MSTTESSTVYSITLILTNNNSQAVDNNAIVDLLIPEDAGMTDAIAIEIGQYFQSIQWASGIQFSVDLSKTTNTSTTLTGSLVSTPPAFS